MKNWMKYVLLYEVKRRLGKIGLAIVWALPRRLVYWSAIRVISHATTGEYGNTIVPELKAVDALDRWEKVPA